MSLNCYNRRKDWQEGEKKARRWSSDCFHLTGVGTLCFSSPARCIHDTTEEEVNANKLTGVSPRYVARMKIALGYCRHNTECTRSSRSCFLLPSREAAVNPGRDRGIARGRSDTDKSFQSATKYSGSVYSATTTTRATVRACPDLRPPVLASLWVTSGSTPRSSRETCGREDPVGILM